MKLSKQLLVKILMVLTIALSPILSQAAQILTDARGITVYSYDLDQGATSKCYSSCAVTWPPVRSLGRQVNGLGTTRRMDGTMQATYQGIPLYYYIGDSAAGETNGDGLDGIWHVIND